MTRLLRWSPWRRAPLLAFRSPSLFAGLGVAGIVLGLAAGSRPVFVSSATSGALHQDLAQGCAYDVGLRITRQAALPGVVAAPSRPDQTPPVDLAVATTAIAAAVGGTPHLGREVTTVFGPNADVLTSTAGAPQEVALLARTGATPGHVHVLGSVATPGVWLPDTTANQVHVSAGGHVKLRVGAVMVPMVVQGVFRDLLAEPDPFWCSLQPQIEAFGGAALPPVALLDQGAMTSFLHQTLRVTATSWWEYPPAATNWTI